MRRGVSSIVWTTHKRNRGKKASSSPRLLLRHLSHRDALFYLLFDEWELDYQLSFFGARGRCLSHQSNRLLVRFGVWCFSSNRRGSQRLCRNRGSELRCPWPRTWWLPIIPHARSHQHVGHDEWIMTGDRGGSSIFCRFTSLYKRSSAGAPLRVVSQEMVGDHRLPKKSRRNIHDTTSPDSPTTKCECRANRVC